MTGWEVQGVASRRSAIVLLVVGACFAALFAVSDTAVIAFVFLPVIPIAIRVAMIRAWVAGDRLHVRNVWRSYVLDRSELAKFVVEDDLDYTSTRQRTVYACFRGRRPRRLAATRRVYRAWPAFVPRVGFRNEADDICEDLNAWLESGA